MKPGSDIHGHAVFKPTATEPVTEYWNASADVKEGEGTASVTPEQVEKGSDGTFTFVATPDDGYEFVCWEFDGDDVYEIISGSLSDPTLVVKPGSDIHGHAIFKLKSTEPPTEPPTEPVTEPVTVTPTTAPDQPQTGDNTNTMLWLIVSILVFVALIVVFVFYFRLRKAEKVGQRFDD